MEPRRNQKAWTASRQKRLQRKKNWFKPKNHRELSQIQKLEMEFTELNVDENGSQNIMPCSISSQKQSFSQSMRSQKELLSHQMSSQKEILSCSINSQKESMQGKADDFDKNSKENATFSPKKPRVQSFDEDCLGQNKIKLSKKKRLLEKIYESGNQSQSSSSQSESMAQNLQNSDSSIGQNQLSKLQNTCRKQIKIVKRKWQLCQGSSSQEEQFIYKPKKPRGQSKKLSKRKVMIEQVKYNENFHWDIRIIELLKVKEFIERAYKKNRFNQKINPQDRYIWISGVCGIGKTSIVRKAVEQSNSQDHTYWINCYDHPRKTILRMINSVGIRATSNNFLQKLYSVKMNRKYKLFVLDEFDIADFDMKLKNQIKNQNQTKDQTKKKAKKLNLFDILMRWQEEMKNVSFIFISVGKSQFLDLRKQGILSLKDNFCFHFIMPYQKQDLIAIGKKICPQLSHEEISLCVNNNMLNHLGDTRMLMNTFRKLQKANAKTMMQFRNSLKQEKNSLLLIFPRVLLNPAYKVVLQQMMERKEHNMQPRYFSHLGFTQSEMKAVFCELDDMGIIKMVWIKIDHVMYLVARKTPLFERFALAKANGLI